MSNSLMDHYVMSLSLELSSVKDLSKNYYGNISLVDMWNANLV